MVKTKNHSYNRKHCSPFKKNRLPFSCLSYKALVKIAKGIDKHVDTSKYTDEQLYNKIYELFKNKHKCKTEACWIEHFKSSKIKDYFRPNLPKDLIKDKTEWLSNFDIEDALYKHDRNIGDFSFLGAVPIDFHKCSVSDKLCKLDIMDYINKEIHKLGIVFNTDESDKPGKHWMSMYIDLKGINLDTPGIYFFDSFAQAPTKEIKNLIHRIANQGKKNDIEFIVSHNDKSYQKNTYACGFYCMHFIEHMLKGLSFNKYLHSGLSDKKMKKYISQCYLNPQEI